MNEYVTFAVDSSAVSMWDDQEPVFYEVTTPQRHSSDTGDWQGSLALRFSY